MDRIISLFSNRYLLAAMGFLFVLGFVRGFARR